MKSIRNSKGLYWGLIITFFVLYFLVGFVSTLHSITFFQLANTMWMAVLLGITYEVGQAAVLFSILMSDNAKKILPWLLMFLLTALQVTANVYASFKFMDSSGSNDWTFWQRSILFWLEADGPEMFKVIISWITGALLPIVALGMTALVAENLKLKDEQNEEKPKEKELEKFVDNVLPVDSDFYAEDLLDLQEEKSPSVKKAEKRDEQLKGLKDLLLNNQEKWPVWGKEPSIVKEPEVEPAPPGPVSEDIKEVFSERKMNPKNIVDELKKDVKETPMLKLGEKVEKTPKNNPRGWHLKKEFIDKNGDVYKFGKFIENQFKSPGVSKTELPKKAKG
jgi:hypothetical protein